MAVFLPAVVAGSIGYAGYKTLKTANAVTEPEIRTDPMLAYADVKNATYDSATVDYDYNLKVSHVARGPYGIRYTYYDSPSGLDGAVIRTSGRKTNAYREI